MGNLAHLFEKAVATASDNRGKPAILGKSDGTLYYTDANGLTHRTRVWARVGEQNSNQEQVVDCLRASPQINMPVRVDHKNGRLTVVDVDDKRAIEFSGGRNGATVPAHAWLHNRLGPDPVFIEGLQYLPLLVTPAATPDLTVTVQGGAYLDDTGALKIHDTAVSGSLSAFVPVSGHHFVIVCLDITDGSIVLVDGADVTVEDALFGDAVVTAADIEAVSISADYKPLAVVLLYAGQTTIVARDIVKDLRTGRSVGSGVPGGSDTQLQYNNGGAFGGIPDFIYNDANGRLLFGASSPETTDKLEIHPTAAQDARISFVSDQAVSAANTVGHDYWLKDDNGDLVKFGSVSVGSTTTTPGSEYGVFKADVLRNGTMRSVLYLDATSGLSFNEDQQDINILFRSVNAPQLLVLDSGADEVRIGSTTPLEGGVAKFTSSGIVFNDEESDRDLRIAGNGVTNGYFYDAGNNRHGFGTGAPAFPFHFLATEGNIARLERNASGNIVFLDFSQPNTTDGNNAIWRFTSDTTGAGASTDVTFGNIFCSYDTHDHATRAGRIFLRTAQDGSLDTRIVIGGNAIGGVNIGTGSPATSAKLEISGTTGALLLPRLTTTQRNALTPTNGMIIYNSTTGVIEGYESGSWVNL